MPYFLKIAALGKFPVVPLSEIDYYAIKNSRLVLNAALAIEEKYDLVISNFLDLEKELLSIAVEHSVRGDLDYTHIYSIRSSLNRRLVNLLTSGRMYLEQVGSDAADCVEDKAEIKREITDLKSNQYDSCLDYRGMEALRNHVQHSGTAVHSISLPSSRNKPEAGGFSRVEFNVDMFAIKSALSENTKFKSSVLEEMPEEFDLKKAARSYVGAISMIQKNVRAFINPRVTSSRLVLEGHISVYKEVNLGSALALGAYEGDLEKIETVSRPVMVMLDWDDVRVSLSEKNGSLYNMVERYTTSKITRG